MSITDELRLPNDTNELDMLLNERGQEHRVWPSGMVVWHDERTVYEYEPAKNHHDEYWGGILRMTMRHLTPEQAIAATLGSCNCSNNCTNSERTETCHEIEDEDTGFIVCSECGAVHDESYTAYYCWCCGRRIEQ